MCFFGNSAPAPHTHTHTTPNSATISILNETNRKKLGKHTRTKLKAGKSQVHEKGTIYVYVYVFAEINILWVRMCVTCVLNSL